MFGFDFRYHALSLIAVLIALAVGLLLGVAIGDKGLVSSAETNLRQSLRGAVHQEQQKVSTLGDQLQTATSVQNDLYPLAVYNQLSGRRIGIVAFGSLPASIQDDTRTALQGSGAQLPLESVSVVQEPVNTTQLASAELGTRYANLDLDPSLLESFGKRVGIQLTQGAGNATSVLNRVRGLILTGGSSGKLDGLDGVVLYRDDTQLKGTDATDTATFEKGLIEGLTARNVPVVGVEESDTNPSQIGWYRNQRLDRTVDDVDTILGQASLVWTLAGQTGFYGQKPTASLGYPRPTASGLTTPSVNP